MKKTIQLSNQETYAYMQAGENNPSVLVLVHGNMSSSFHFTPVFETLAKDYHVIAPDLRGFGDSSYDQPLESLHDLADDLKRFLDALNIQKASLAGWSTGGAVILSFAARYPIVTEKLILIESASLKGYPIFKKDDQFQPILTELYQDKAAMAADPVQVAPAVQAMETKNHAYLKNVWQAAIYNVKVPDEIDAYIDESLKQRNLVDIDWALMTFNMSDDHNGVVPGDGTYKDVKAPILNIWGRKDFVIPEVMFNQNVEAFKEAESLILDNGSHSPITDEPETLIQAIHDFL